MVRQTRFGSNYPPPPSPPPEAQAFGSHQDVLVSLLALNHNPAAGVCEDLSFGADVKAHPGPGEPADAHIHQQRVTFTRWLCGNLRKSHPATPPPTAAPVGQPPFRMELKETFIKGKGAVSGRFDQ